MQDKVLVTGGTGFVAGAVIMALLTHGYGVRTTLRDLSREAALRAAFSRRGVSGMAFECMVADLTADAGWTEVMEGCRFVLHVASPLGGAPEKDLIATAVEGTRRVFSAAQAVGVERVVMTSSTAACTPAKPSLGAFNESDWTNPDQPGLAAYRRSKVLAERTAWTMAEDGKTELVTLLPGAIFGPVLNPYQSGSVGIIRGLLQGQPSLLPRLAFNITDVRDLAALHVAAMTAPKAAGERFIVLGEALWFSEIAKILRDRLGEHANKVPTRRLPDFAAKLLAHINPQMRELLPLLGRTQKFSAAKACHVLGYAPRSAADTLVDCAESLRF
jgi:nucleoside-diphosphate-sugar epimerase